MEVVHCTSLYTVRYRISGYILGLHCSAPFVNKPKDQIRTSNKTLFLQLTLSMGEVK